MGVSYSQNAVLTEYFNRVEVDNRSYLILFTAVREPTYLKEDFITSEQFFQEPDDSKWHPTPCTTERPAR
jgi:hypothetical protein